MQNKWMHLTKNSDSCWLRGQTLSYDISWKCHMTGSPYEVPG